MTIALPAGWSIRPSLADAVIRLSQGLPGSAKEIVTMVRAAGLEGVIAKRRLDSTYQAGECSCDRVQLKLEREQELAIGIAPLAQMVWMRWRHHVGTDAGRSRSS